MKNIALLITMICTGMFVSAQNWNQIPSNTLNNLNAIDFPSTNVGYIVGDSSLILKTTDGGQTWNEISATGISIPGLNPFIDVDFVTELHGFITTKHSGVFETADGGFNWTPVSLASGQCFPSTFYIDSSDHFFVGGAGCFQGAMMDEFTSGTWTIPLLNAMLLDNAETIMEIDFGDDNTGLAVVHNDLVFRTVDGGTTWDTISTALSPTGFLTSVKMVDNLVAYAGYDEGGGGFGILKTVDGGLTWLEELNSATFYYPSYNCVEIASNGDVYSGATPSSSPGGLIFETVDGVNWIYEITDQSINEMASYGDDVTFAVGDSGYIVVNVLPVTLDVDNVDYNNLKVYPNPAQDKITLQLILADESKLKVISTAGKEIPVKITQFNGTTVLDVSEMPKGVYIIRICETDNVQNVKFIKD
jgi:photosystem II stability/assembly factor-like uncharacterized protein